MQVTAAEVPVNQAAAPAAAPAVAQVAAQAAPDLVAQAQEARRPTEAVERLLDPVRDRYMVEVDTTLEAPRCRTEPADDLHADLPPQASSASRRSPFGLDIGCTAHTTIPTRSRTDSTTTQPTKTRRSLCSASASSTANAAAKIIRMRLTSTASLVTAIHQNSTTRLSTLPTSMAHPPFSSTARWKTARPRLAEMSQPAAIHRPLLVRSAALAGLWNMWAGWLLEVLLLGRCGCYDSSSRAKTS